MQGPYLFHQQRKELTMSSIKNFFAVSFGILGAIILAPFVALFGLMMGASLSVWP